MFLKFIYPLVKYFSALNVFKYLSFRAVYAAVTALLVAFLVGPWVIERLRLLKLGQVIRTDGPQTHLAKSGTPTMGGIFVILSIVLAVMLWVDLGNIYFWICLIALLGFGLIGFLDDWLKIKLHNSDGLSAWRKLIIQFLVAGIVVFMLYLNRTELTTQLFVPFFKSSVLDLGIFYYPLAVVYIVTWSNAVNLADGLDGLATGLTIMALIGFSILTYISGRADWAAYLNIPFIRGSGELLVFNLALIGACVGFLWFNSHPAEVFMGDVGALALGAVLGTMSLIVKKEILLIIIGGVFVLQMGSVILQVAFFKITKGKRLFKMTPLHHHFEEKGWKETQVVVRFWILGGLFMLIALSTLKIQ